MIPLAKFAMLRARRRSGTIAFFNYATNTGTGAVTMPASILAGDIAVLVDSAYNDAPTAAPSSAYPSSWTAIGSSVTHNETSTGIRHRTNVSYKVLVGSESSSSISGMSGAFDAKVILVFRPTGGSWTAPSSINAVAQGTQPSNQTVTVSGDPGVIIGWASDMMATAPDLGMSPAATATYSDGVNALDVGYLIYNSGATNNTVSTSGMATYGGAMGSFWLPLGA